MGARIPGFALWLPSRPNSVASLTSSCTSAMIKLEPVGQKQISLQFVAEGYSSVLSETNFGRTPILGETHPLSTTCRSRFHKLKETEGYLVGLCIRHRILCSAIQPVLLDCCRSKPQRAFGTSVEDKHWKKTGCQRQPDSSFGKSEAMMGPYLILC